MMASVFRLNACAQFQVTTAAPDNESDEDMEHDPLAAFLKCVVELKTETKSRKLRSPDQRSNLDKGSKIYLDKLNKNLTEK